LVGLLLVEDSWHFGKWECMACGATMVWDNFCTSALKWTSHIINDLTQLLTSICKVLVFSNLAHLLKLRFTFALVVFSLDFASRLESCIHFIAILLLLFLLCN
jgi:hypothetical protein